MILFLVWCVVCVFWCTEKKMRMKVKCVEDGGISLGICLYRVIIYGLLVWKIFRLRCWFGVCKFRF